ncbi:MAG: phosphatase PAP2 family protein [Candidatus Marinimicrobia bacterium]|nr:phosphatase PAP2 family protein [Candidatus Neomarinimicrobiota bacterium]
MLDFLIQLDTKLLLFLNGLHTPLFDKIMWVISAKETWYPFYLILIALLIFIYRKKSIWIVLGLAILITLSDQISTEVLKKGFERFRPSHNDAIKNMLHIINNYRGGKYGFVSSHAANTFAGATFITNLVDIKNLRWIMYVWAGVVSYSRIYLGVHYPGDIIGGAILGILLGLMIVYLLKKFVIKDEEFEYGVPSKSTIL